MEQADAARALRPMSGRRRRRRAKVTAVGAVVTLLALIGLGFLIWRLVTFSVGYVKEYLGPTEDVSFFEAYIGPVVMQDPSPFSDTRRLDTDFIVKTAIWAALTDDSNNSKFSYTGDNREILPKATVSDYVTKLFGADVKPSFRTFTDPATSTTYEYNGREGCFYIPEIAYSDYFTPEVRAVNRSGDTVRLTVDYISGYGWAQDSHGSVTPPPASKTMIYVLRGSRGKYRIVSVEPAASAASAASSVSSVTSSVSSDTSTATSAASGVSSGSSAGTSSAAASKSSR